MVEKKGVENAASVDDRHKMHRLIRSTGTRSPSKSEVLKETVGSRNVIWSIEWTTSADSLTGPPPLTHASKMAQLDFSYLPEVEVV